MEDSVSLDKFNKFVRRNDIMKKTKISETQIIKAIREYESGSTAEVVCREYGISRATLYNWKKKYSGMESSQLKRLKELEEENRRLKHMYAELSIDHRILKEVIEKKL
jgi:putative transposase